MIGTSGYRSLPKDSVERLDAATLERSKSAMVSRDLRNDIQALHQELAQYAMPEEGDLVAGARLLSEVGLGAFGVVWRARDLETGLDVAVKVFRRERLAVELALHQFRRGIRIMRRLSESSEVPGTVVRFLRADDADTAFLMEYVPCHDLAANVRGWNIEHRLEVFRRVCEAVAFSHSKGVVHRDIRPQNILVRDDATPVLADFDIADFTSLTKNTQLSPGTAVYSAPEQLAGDMRRKAVTVDIFSLGRLLQFLLLQHDPLIGVRELNAFPGYNDVLSRALAIDPARRPQSVGELLQLIPVGVLPNLHQSELYGPFAEEVRADIEKADRLWAVAVKLAASKKYWAAVSKADKAIELIREIDYDRCDDWQRERARWEVAKGDRPVWAYVQEEFFRYATLKLALPLGGLAVIGMAAVPLAKLRWSEGPTPSPSLPAQPIVSTAAPSSSPPQPTVSASAQPTPSIVEPPLPPTEEPKATMFVLDYAFTHKAVGARGRSEVANRVLADLARSGYDVEGVKTADEARFPGICRNTAGLYHSVSASAGSPDEEEIRRIVKDAYRGSKIEWAQDGGVSEMKTVKKFQKSANVLILPTVECGN
jgi:predicted Ser/Thr protein kinase